MTGRTSRQLHSGSQIAWLCEDFIKCVSDTSFKTITEPTVSGQQSRACCLSKSLIFPHNSDLVIGYNIICVYVSKFGSQEYLMHRRGNMAPWLWFWTLQLGCLDWYLDSTTSWWWRNQLVWPPREDKHFLGWAKGGIDRFSESWKEALCPATNSGDEHRSST